MTASEMRNAVGEKTSREQYDELWSGVWGDMQTFGPVHRHQRTQLVKLISSLCVSTVLDVGCGAGDNLAALADTLPRLVLSGADVSSEALSLTKKRVPRAALHQLDVQQQALEERFDLVMAVQVIEHLADDISALRNMGLMAKSHVLVTTMRGRMRPSEREIGHFRNYSNAELRSKARSAGLEVLDIFGWGFPFYSPLYRTLAEWLPGGPPKGHIGQKQKLAANLLYYLYSLNIPRLGDVVTMLAHPSRADR